MNLGAIQKRLDEIGFRKRTPEELRALFELLNKQIAIGVQRTDESARETDGGIRALPSYVQPLSAEAVAAIPIGARCIVGACGGTNWTFGVAMKGADGQVTIEYEKTVAIPERERQHTFTSFAAMIAEHVLATYIRARIQKGTVLPVAISFAFHFDAVVAAGGSAGTGGRAAAKTNRDMDARLMHRDLNKSWIIRDVDESLTAREQPSMIKAIREYARTNAGIEFGRMVIVNDTVAVALDIDSADDLPAGFVFGTGCNAAMYFGDKRGIVNGEIETASATKDTFWELFIQSSRSGRTQPVVGDWINGEKSVQRVETALRAITTEYPAATELADKVRDTQSPSFISDAAQTNAQSDDATVLQLVAQRDLELAAQYIGVMITSTAQAVKKITGNHHMLYEGSVFEKGYRVQERALETVKVLLPELTLIPTKANGMIGVAKLALAE